MNYDDVLSMIPRPSDVRESLARNVREKRMLLALLKLSIQAAAERQRREDGIPAGSKNDIRLATQQQIFSNEAIK
jgi:hypothetical protein